MTASSYLTRLSDRLVRPIGGDDGGPGRRWMLGKDGLSTLDVGSAAPGDIVAVPTEQVLVLVIDLPLGSRRQRIEALPFAIEDRIADPLSAVHLALGAEVAPQRYLVGIVRHELMRRWLTLIEAARPATPALVPDALLLPRPEEGSWTVRILGDRALVRSDDGGGFAIQAAQLEAAWIAAGRPAGITAHDCVRTGMPGEPDAQVIDRLDEPPPLDLRQGPYAVPRRSLSAVGRRVALVAAAGLAAHGTIAIADTLVLHGIAADKEAQARALVAAAIPGLAADADFVSVATERWQATAQRPVPDRLLPLLDRISSALGTAGSVNVRGLSYDGGRDLLVIEVEPGSEGRFASYLVAAGLSVTTGAGRLIVAGQKG